MSDLQLVKLKKTDLIKLAEAALAALPQEERDFIVAKHVPESMKPTREPGSPPNGRKFLRRVEKFLEESLAEMYFDARPRKDARGWPEDPPLTNEWCRIAKQLCEEGMALAAASQYNIAAKGLERLLDLLHQSHDGNIVYADEFGIGWYVLVDFKKLLKAFFTSLANSTTPEEFARRGLAIASLWTWKEEGAMTLLQRSARGPYRSALQQAQDGGKKE